MGMRIKVDGYLLKHLSPVDVTQGFCDGLNSDAVRDGLNFNFQPFTPDTLRAFLGRFDRKTNHAIGIFNERREIVGIYTIDVLALHRSAILTAAIWEPGSEGGNVLLKTINELLDYFFHTEGIQKIGARIARSNWRITFNMLYGMQRHDRYRQRFFYEGTLRQEYQRHDGSRIDVMCFGAYHPDLNVQPDPVANARLV